MHVQAVQEPWLRYVVPLAIVAAVMLLRWRRMRRAQRLRLETLWILPAVYAAVVALVFRQMPPTAAGWGWAALALGAGAAIGWYRGRMMRISVDPHTHALSQQASPAAFLLLVVLVVIRSAARQGLGDGYGGAPQGAMLATDIAMAFALGLIAGTRVEMALRARRLLREARASGVR